MTDVKAYLLSVCGAVIFCAVTDKILARKEGTAGIGRMLTGVFLLLTVLRPVSSFDLRALENFSINTKSDAMDAVRIGEENTQQAMTDIIKSKTAAYILQKAEALDMDISVEISVTNDTVPVPEKVYLNGNAAPFAKQQLIRIIEQDIGVSKENQIWT